MRDAELWRQAWPAPAKLNLFLHITARRADGYHELQTLFQFLDYGDRLRFRPRADGLLTRSTPVAGIDAADDLCLRAARLLRETTAGGVAGVEIELDKRLPMGGGLGGGSSDAATVLLVLNRLWRLGLGIDALAELGLRLGADVPVFVRGHAAWAEGVGERIEPVEPDQPWYLVLAPPVQVSTAEVFRHPELTRHCPPIRIRDFLRGAAGNVCTPVVRMLAPIVGDYLDWLARFGAARMTGSGACVFVAFASEAEARQVFESRPAGWAGFVARGCNRSPLHLALERGTKHSQPGDGPPDD